MKIFIEVKDKKIVSGAGEIKNALLTAENGYYTIDIQKGSRRSVTQNKYYWAVITAIGQDIGYSPIDTHDIFRNMFLKKEWNDPRMGLIVSIKSTGDMTIDEFTSYMENIIEWGKANGIEVPIYQ